MSSPTPAIPGYRDFVMIAHGSTAFVYRALQERLDRTVAVKVLLVDDDMTTTASVEKELEATVTVSNHPHIVSIIDTGATEDGRPYIVMEYCQGGSYSQILKSGGPLSIEDVIDVGVKIGQALQAAHNADILHRDVKPQNILRAQYGPALADFGIARAPAALSGTTAIDKLTPLHASPEALLRQAQTPASDLFSLASSMWHLLAGFAPFANPEGGTAPETHRDRVTSQAPPPKLPRGDVPEWLEGLLVRALARDPARRPVSCAAFAEELQMGMLTDRLESKEVAERTVVLPSEDTLLLSRVPPTADQPNAPFTHTLKETSAFTPPPASLPAAVHTARLGRRRIRPEMYPLLAVLLISLVVALGGVGVVWALADDDRPNDTTEGDSDGPPSQEVSDDEVASEPGEVVDETVAIDRIEPRPSGFTLFTDAEAGDHDCTLAVEGLDAASDGDCAEIAIDGLYASSEYELVLEVEGTEQEPIVETAATATIEGEVYWDCPPTRTYCESVDYQIGVGADPARTETIGTTEAGDRFDLICHTDGVNITPRGEESDGYWDYHPGKHASAVSIRVDYEGQTGYIPFVWMIVEPGDLNSTGELPPC